MPPFRVSGGNARRNGSGSSSEPTTTSGRLFDEEKSRMRLTIIGTGYVGLVAAACFAELGHQITCVDNDRQKIELLRAGEVPICEEFLPELLAKHRGRRLNFTTDLAEALANCSAVFIAVGTPTTEQGEADMTDRKSTRLNSSHVAISYAVFCLKKKKNATIIIPRQ